MGDIEYTVHGRLNDGGEVRRYVDGQWWIVGPEGSMYPGQRIKVGTAARRSVFDGQPILGVPGGKIFDRLVAAERDVQRDIIRQRAEEALGR